MVARLNGRAGHYLLLLAASFMLFMNNLGGPSLWDLDEGRNATASLEMLESGDYVVPTFNAQLRVDKPIMLYWLQVASYHLFGINELAARLPSALAAMGVVMVCYELGRSMFGPISGLLGALILGSTALMVGAGRFANPDATLNFFIALTLLIFWRGHGRPTSWWFAGLGTLLGCAALTKGPVGVLLPVVVMVSYLAWENRLRVLWDRRVLWGVLALALVALPWYVWVAVETRGVFLRGFLGEHNLSRFFHPMDRHAGSPLYYPLVLLIGLAPWSVVLAFASWFGFWSMVRQPWPRAADWWRRTRDGAAPAVAGYRLLGVWVAWYLIFFSAAATKLPNYLLPIALPAALLGGRFLDRWRRGELFLPSWVMFVCLSSLALVGSLTGAGLMLVAIKLPLDPFPGPYINGLQYWGLLSLLPIGAALIGWWALRRGHFNGVVVSFIAGTVLFLSPLAAWVLPAFNQVKAPAALVEQSGALGRERDIRIGGYQLEHLPSVNFYAQRDVIYPAGDEEAVAFLEYPVPVYLFMPSTLWDGLKNKAPRGCRVLASHADLYRARAIVVVANAAVKDADTDQIAHDHPFSFAHWPAKLSVR